MNTHTYIQETQQGFLERVVYLSLTLTEDLLDEEMHKKKKAKQEEHQSKAELRKIAHEKRLKRLRRIVKGLWRLFNTNEDSDGQSDAGSSTCSSNITQDSGVNNNNNNNTKRKDSFSRMKKSSQPSIFDKRNAAHRISVLWGNVANEAMNHGNGPRRKSRLSQIRRNSMSKRLQRLLEQKKVRRQSTCVLLVCFITLHTHTHTHTHTHRYIEKTKIRDTEIQRNCD